MWSRRRPQQSRGMEQVDRGQEERIFADAREQIRALSLLLAELEKRNIGLTKEEADAASEDQATPDQ
ncbi:hypothetical protein JYT20_00035 [Rhodothermus sp. AH-315-K08]|nr:hypothetical protein [Rhodothermus sp. AH-315-K08]